MDLINSSMKSIVCNLKNIEKLNPSLVQFLENGFITTKNGGVFFKGNSVRLRIEHANILLGDELTDYENFINKIHIDDYCDNFVFEEAILFMEIFTRRWQAQFPKVTCVAGISFQEDENMGKMAAFSFLIERGVPWFGSNIEGFSQPVFIRYIE